MISPLFLRALILDNSTNAPGNKGEKWSHGFLQRALEHLSTTHSLQLINKPKGEEKTSQYIAPLPFFC